MNHMARSVVLVALVSGGTVWASHGIDTSPRLHLHDDVNRDFQADVYFHGGTALAFWELGSPMGGAAPVSSRYAGDAGPGYSLVTVSDFTGDGASDVLWADGRQLKMWINDGSGKYAPVMVGSYGGGWQPFAAGDINGDGRSDILFRGSTHLAFWIMAGPQVLRSRYGGDGGPGYRPVAVRDFTGRDANRNRSADVLWANGSQMKIWISDPGTATFTSVPIGSYGGGWQPFAGGDVNGDSVADILFRGGSHIAYWEQRSSDVFTGFDYVSRYGGDGGPGYRAIGVSQYGSVDSEVDPDDILWSNGSDLKLWFAWCRNWDWDTGCGRGNSEFLPAALGSYGNGWQPVETVLPGT